MLAHSYNPVFLTFDSLAGCWQSDNRAAPPNSIFLAEPHNLSELCRGRVLQVKMTSIVLYSGGS